MNRARPPGNGKGARQGADPGDTEATQSVADFPELRNIARIVYVRRCLAPDTWAWLEWEAACNTGGYLP